MVKSIWCQSFSHVFPTFCGVVMPLTGGLGQGTGQGQRDFKGRYLRNSLGGSMGYGYSVIWWDAITILYNYYKLYIYIYKHIYIIRYIIYIYYTSNNKLSSGETPFDSIFIAPTGPWSAFEIVTLVPRRLGGERSSALASGKIMEKIISGHCQSTPLGEV